MKRIAHYQYLEYVRVMSLMRQYQAASARPLRVLDFGCGLGKFLNVFASLGMEVTGVDANPAYVAGAREKGFQAYEPEAFFATTQDPFDVVFLSHLIEHVTPDALVALVPRLCARLARNGRMIMLSPTPGERFYHDFSHIRPYLPQSIRHAFGATGMPISYGEAGLLEMVDIHFFKDPYRTRLWRSFYVNRGIKGAFTRQYNRLLDVLWRASGGRIGKTASWLGVYELRARS
ncbi:methyltransferase [Cupriavidus sp. SHE]|jgi:SAM-dependent methyltransferase|uniref:Class I SAM-dependent methyltransferase n=1 Tax=Cupriavidus metallidurans TaxID=119219 RepID=A0A482IW53_9BURK|nr:MULTISPECIES: class I SAM-dependent methyltransferase [Cupriavidus]KWR85615.1 methyltransferase [Cupriavidus sp. SHE]QBP13198.1 class I SAM-dependent methyltransferase [Cupriavidus metallidurans]